MRTEGALCLPTVGEAATGLVAAATESRNHHCPRRRIRRTAALATAKIRNCRRRGKIWRGTTTVTAMISTVEMSRRSGNLLNWRKRNLANLRMTNLETVEMD
jgi:hypothetical protein